MTAYHRLTKQSISLGLIFIFGALIRILPIFDKSVWFDEYLTLQIVKLPWIDIIQGNYFGDSHPPLYYLTLKLISLFSMTEMTYRLVSWLFSIASIPLAYILGSKITTPYISLIYSLLIATNTSFIFYATEIRQYAFLIFLVLFALTATTHTTKTWKILGLLSMTAATYTHFFGIFTLLMCAAIAVASNRIQNLKVIAIALIISIPIIYYYLRITQVSYYSIQYQADPRMGLDIISYALNIFGNVQLTQSLVLDLFQIQNIIGLFLFILGFICYYQAGLKKVFLVLFFILYILIVGIISANRMYFYGRYIIPGIIFGILIVSGCGQYLKHKYLRLIPIGLIIYSSILAINFPPLPTLSAAYARQTAAIIAINKHINERVVLLGWDTTPIAFYLDEHEKYLTSYEFETQITETAHLNSYLLIDSEFARKIPQLQEACFIYQNPYVKVYRYPANCN